MHSSVIDSNVLRSEAEGQLSHGPSEVWGLRSNEELIHELRVHQVELEMQNEELRRTHLILDQSRDRYIQLYDHSPVGFILLDRDGLISEANLTATKLFVVDRQHLMTCRFAGLVAPQDCDRWYLFFRTIINCVQCMTIELTLKSFDNREFPVQLSCVSIKSILHITIIDTAIIKQEEVIRTLRVMSLNVAQTSKTEKNQEKSLDFLRDVIKEDHRTMKTMYIDSLSRLQDISCSVPGVIYQFRLLADGTSSFPYASSALLDIFRLSPAQVQHDASQWFALVHEDDLADLLTSTQNSAKDLTLWQHDFRIKFDDGVERWVSGNSLPQLEHDGSVLWNGFMTDISERKQSDLDLEDSQMRWKFAVEGSGDGLWDYNIETNEMLYA
ncbi:MAG: PAS domain-containing protein, partial [Methylobacter sp.]|nr:PAS domain-containing protein [Methylobacter sp.]